jgi:hypothetical protein
LALVGAFGPELGPVGVGPGADALGGGAQLGVLEVLAVGVAAHEVRGAAVDADRRGQGPGISTVARSRPSASGDEAVDAFVAAVAAAVGEAGVYGEGVGEEFAHRGAAFSTEGLGEGDGLGAESP